jgi:hypothetical protein
MPLDWPALRWEESGFPRRKPLMPKPCSQRDRLREAYYQLTLEASRLSDALAHLIKAVLVSYENQGDRVEIAYLLDSSSSG